MRDEPRGDAGQPGSEARGGEWIDRLLGAIDNLSGPTWATYLAAALVVLAASHAVAWLEGVVAPWQPDAYRASLAIYVTGPLAALHYFHRLAPLAMRRFRPALADDEDLYDELERDLRRLPGGPAVLWALAGLLIATAYVATGPDPSSLLQQQPLTFGFDLAVTFFSFPVAWILGYHTIRQLRQVALIHSLAVKVDLFQPEPLYAFSILTARTGGALVALAYISAATDPTTFTNPALIATTAVMLLVAISCFVLPLFGMHGRIVVEKARLEAEAGSLVAQTIQELNRRVRVGDDAGAGALTRVIEGLVIQRTTIRAIPTWPWRTETLRGFVSAVVLPVGLWLLFRALERLLTE